MMVGFFYSWQRNYDLRSQTYEQSLPSPRAKLADCAYRLWRYLAVRGDISLTITESGTSFADYTPSGKLCSFYPIRRIGMASTRLARCMELRRSRAWHRAKRVSKLVLLRIDSIHHFVMIPYDCFAINSIPQQVADSIHTFGLVIYSQKARRALAFVRMIYNASH